MPRMTMQEVQAYEARRARENHVLCPSTDAVAVESDLHASIIDTCKSRGWIYLHGSMAAATHRTEGEPDFVILADGGRVIFVECKSKAGKLSLAQSAMMHHAAKLGTTIYVIRSQREFEGLINDLGL